MNPFPTSDGWSFYDKSKTSAEIVVELYRAIYETAKEYHVMILGCNTIGHLGAGLMQMQNINNINQPPKAETPEDILASIINPPIKKE